MAPTEERGIIIVGNSTPSTMAKAIACATDAGLTVLETPASTLTNTMPTSSGIHEILNTRMVSQFPDKKTRWGRAEMRKMAKETESMHKAAQTCAKNRAKRKKKKR